MTTSTEAVPGYPYLVYRHGERVFPVFVENPADYIGKHRFHVDPVLEVDPSTPTVAPLGADDNWTVGLDYDPKHAAEVAS